jgi:hypothetical protein
MDDEFNELAGYESAIGWEEPDPYKRQREKALEELAKDPSGLQADESMLAARPAGEWFARSRDRKVYSNELFGSLWRLGEVAVLFGDKGSGKSILAVQIAADIASGTRALSSPPYEGGVSELRGRGGSLKQKVLFLDFQRSAQQWAERYSAPSPVSGKPPIRYRFPRNFIRAAVEWYGDIPEAFRNNLDAYLHHSILEKIRSSDARVVIIDNISYLGRNSAVGVGALRAMKTLKLWASAFDLSILVIADSKCSPPSSRTSKTLPTPKTLHTLSTPIASLADSVFAIGRSTFGPDYRYVKHLASPGPIIHDADNVLTFQLSAPVAPASGGAVVAGPKFKYLGPSSEFDHLRDYAAEALAAERREQEALRKLRTRSSKAALIDGLLDGTYARYLES